jgi:hypothetical protein
VVGNGPAIKQRGQPRALAWLQHAMNRIPMQISAAPATPGMKAVTEHFNHGYKLPMRQIPVRPGYGKGLIKVILMPLAAGNLGDDLLRQHIQRMRWD